MTIRTFVAAFVVVLLAPAANAALSEPSVSPSPTVSRQMQWFRWHPPVRSVGRPAVHVGSVGVIGLQSMRDLHSLRARYGFEVVRVLPELHAAVIVVNHSLLATLGRSRIRYLAPLGPSAAWRRCPTIPCFHRSTRDRPAVRVAVRSLACRPRPRAVGRKPDDRGRDDRHRRRRRARSGGEGRRTLDGCAGRHADPRCRRKRRRRPRDRRRFPDRRKRRRRLRYGRLRGRHASDRRPRTSPHRHGGRRRADEARQTRRPDREHELRRGQARAPILRDAIRRAEADGMLLVAAAGNSTADVAYPAADLQPPGGGPSYGLAVGATDVSGNLASFSNSGDGLSLVAPGGYQDAVPGPGRCPAPRRCLRQLLLPNWTGAGGAYYAYLAGTSFSAPEVAGVAALIWAKRPELTNYQVAGIIKQSARRDGAGWTRTMGCGALDAGAALELATTYSGVGGPDGPCSTAGDPPPIEPEVRPTVFALPASGRWSGPLRSGSGWARRRMRLRRRSTSTERLDRRQPRQRPVRRRSPDCVRIGMAGAERRKKGAYRFCVTLTRLSGTRARRVARRSV